MEKIFSTIDTIIFLIFITFFLNITPVCLAQENEGKTYLYTEVDELPVFGESNEGLFQYIFSKLNWPKHFDGSGEAIVSLIINEEGQVYNVVVVKKLCDECDEQAKTILENMPPWKPGEKDGKPVKVKMYIPIKFVLE